MTAPALMPYRPPGHPSFVDEPDTEPLRRLLCALAAGPALRELRADEVEQRQPDAADRADVEIDEDADDRRERRRERLEDRR